MLTAFVITGIVLILVFYVIALVLAYRVGWEHAHLTVAKECETQGKFFVKNKIYHVEKIEEIYNEK